MDTMVVILAGGRGRRMGGNKPLFPYGASTLIEATLARLKSQSGRVAIDAGVAETPLAADLALLGLPLVFDQPPFDDLGPLSGVRTALAAACDTGDEVVVTVPCDMPHLPLDFVARLTDSAAKADIVHFTGADDYRLCGLWRTNLLPALDQALLASRADGGLRVTSFLEKQKLLKLPTGDDKAFRNINRPEDLRPEDLRPEDIA